MYPSDECGRPVLKSASQAAITARAGPIEKNKCSFRSPPARLRSRGAAPVVTFLLCVGGDISTWLQHYLRHR